MDAKKCVYIRLERDNAEQAEEMAARLPSCRIVGRDGGPTWFLNGGLTTIAVGEVPSLPRKRELREQLAAARGRIAELEQKLATYDDARAQAILDLLRKTGAVPGHLDQRLAPIPSTYGRLLFVTGWINGTVDAAAGREAAQDATTGEGGAA